VRRLSDAFDPSCLSWSPDGKRIAFASGNSLYLYNLNSAPSSLWVADVTTGKSVRVTDGVHFDFSPVWTPDGRSLLFISDRGGGLDIYLVSLGSEAEPIGEPERLTTGLNAFTIASSADGRTISYSVATARQNIWSLPVPEGGPVSILEARPVTTGSRRIEGVGVSSDGKWLAFSSDQAGKRAIFKMAVGGSEQVQVTAGPMDHYPTWSPDGREIAFHGIRTGNRDIFIVSADGGTVRQLTNDEAQDYYAHWSPDGKRIVFFSSRNGVNDEASADFQIYAVSRNHGELSGETPVQLTLDGGAAPRWSPDGSLIAYNEGRTWNGIKVIASDGGEPRRLTDFGHSPMWSKDSRTIYFRETRPDEHFGIWSVSRSGGEPRPLVRFDDPARKSHYPEWSTDGEHFYFTLTEFEADVWVMELEGSKR
jgi:TolB protein